MRLWLQSGLVTLSLLGGVQEASLPAQDGQPALEIYRFNADALRATLPASDAIPTDEVDAYLFVLRLEPGERFVSGRVEIRDGYFCLPRKRSRAGALFGHVGYELLAAEAPAEVRGSLALLRELVAPAQRPPMKLKRRVKLKGREVEHHDGYVAFVLPATGGPTTRASMTRIVTERPGVRRSESRRRSRGAWVPDDSEPKISKQDMVRILVRGER